jgi:hypothetical protein
MTDDDLMTFKGEGGAGLQARQATAAAHQVSLAKWEYEFGITWSGGALTPLRISEFTNGLPTVSWTARHLKARHVQMPRD